ncbi:unnamed protein product [Onchocerca flexuosa]|uniref:Uncharacterized protein n=1 Tax=Onchocerca flexuosa TaxID=387005 RepID=A0A183HHM6_9BILA|nr:unnamed protein product [Onchocerca flexuosa]
MLDARADPKPSANIKRPDTDRPLSLSSASSSPSPSITSFFLPSYPAPISPEAKVSFVNSSISIEWLTAMTAMTMIDDNDQTTTTTTSTTNDDKEGRVDE